jgi:hypothetical protein
MEEWEIFSKTHELLNKIEKNGFDHQRLEELLFVFNLENVYRSMNQKKVQ